MGNACSKRPEKTLDRKATATTEQFPRSVEPKVKKESERKEPPSPNSQLHTYVNDTRFLAAFNPLNTDKETDLIYTLPNDDAEIDRLHLQHYMLRFAWQGNYCAPVTEMLKQSEARILDAGCGSGIWAMEMATDFPHAQVEAFDLAAVQPTTIKPNNLEFSVHDVTQPLPWPDNTFDFVRMRFLVVGLKTETWPLVIKELARIVKPGGYLELCEPMGADLHIARKLKGYIQDCGNMEKVTEDKREIPSCRHPGNPQLDRLAAYARDDMIAGLRSFKPAVVGGMKQMTSEEYDEAIKGALAEMEVGKGTWSTFVAYGRKTA
ncbi:hypothetical protein HK104_005670 [Borealophlyctis nickersoniae]|nr:hypothetical protein HK104_005670 [Borealophlyctis nickersoniae]